MLYQLTQVREQGSMGSFLGGDDTCKHALPTNSVVRALGRAHHIWKIEKNTQQEEGTVI